MKQILPVLLFYIVLVFGCHSETSETAYTSWPKSKGSEANISYSALTQVDTGNVGQLQVAWEFHTGDADTAAHSQIQCNPIIVNGTMYCTSPQLKLFALDAATGKQKWVFSPFDSIPGAQRVGHFILNNNRGVTYWTDGKD